MFTYDAAFYICYTAVALAALSLIFLAYELGRAAGLALKQDNEALRHDIERSTAANGDLLAENAALRTERDQLQTDNAALLVQLEEQAKAALKPASAKRKSRQ